MIYYLLLGVCCLLTAVRLVFNKMYVRLYGSSAESTYRFTFLSTLIFSIVLLALCGFRLEVTPFSFVLGLLMALINVICTAVGFRVLEVGTLSKYTLFLSLGGMIIPFLYGFVFNGDSVTLGKVICLLLITAALFVQTERGGGDRRALFYYLAVFSLNGLACIVLSLHQNGLFSFRAVSTESFTVLYMLQLAVLSLVLMLLLRGRTPREQREGRPPLLKAVAISAAFGLLFGFGNYLSTLSLLHIEPSYQFPILTGGGVLLSGVMGLFFGERIRPRFVISASFVVLGTLSLLL